jgi:hypothetical protein
MSRNNLNQQQSEYFPANGKYLICGLAPGDSGTGRFFRVLLQDALKQEFAVISPMPGVELTTVEQTQIATIRNSAIVILHPQYLGLTVTRALLENNNAVSMYVLDNGFFCMKSYNHIDGENQECLRCIASPRNVRSDCSPFPIRYPKDENTEFLLSLQKHAPRITFFCQTLGQETLIRKHFGAETKTVVIGMTTRECNVDEEVHIPETVFDIVFHGVAIEAKGARYSLDLAAALPQLRFLFPFSAQEMLNLVGTSVALPENCIFQPMRWDSGLKEMVTHCQMVLVPSLWSAPVEGALMKSVFYNGRVGVFDTEYGFQREIPEQFLCRLTADINSSAAAIRNAVMTPIPRTAARDWVVQYDNAVDLSAVFRNQFQTKEPISKGFEQ